MPTREDALALLHEWVDNEGLINHMKAVEAAVRQYARELGEDEETWGLAGLLHDLDWEKYPDEHPLRAVDELRARGYPEEVLQAILAHRSDFTSVQPESKLDRVLVACDELTGLVNATALVRPTGIDDLTPKSVKKKMKDKAFAAGVDREDVRRGAELLGVELDEHIAKVIAAMQEIAEELGLRKSPAAEQSPGPI
ncbi:MAG TPA: HD domain-containing protein [Longimicrobiales bacterium]|nr:HD domain-containing protein [Longimicrobiales bacterium]